MLSWYVLNSKPHSENFVLGLLGAKGIEGYLPLWSPAPRRRKSASPRPFFPSYLFVRADLDVTGLSDLMYLPGVRRLVFCGGEPARVAPNEIESIRRHLLQVQNEPLDAAGHRLSPGDRVLINDGPFRGFNALFDHRISSGQRVAVLINFLQRRTRVELDAEFIQKQMPARTMRIAAN